MCGIKYMRSLLLYVFPIFCRIVLDAHNEQNASWSDIALSVLPILITLPSVMLSSYVRDARQEHVWRHALYAAAFCASAATTIRWDRLSMDDSGRALVGYFVVGGVSLWWFTLCHCIENRYDPHLRTHQGDVVVLPLTLVAIATFVHDVPDEVFRFSRSTPFFVPVIVSWATLYFIAYHGFASGKTTTLDAEHFRFHAFCAAIVASAQLCLLELRARPLIFQAFPLIAALLAQTMHPSHASLTRRDHLLGATVVALLINGCLVSLLRGVWQLAPSLLYVVFLSVTAISVLAFPGVSRAWYWLIPSTGYATLLTVAFLDVSAMQVDAARIVWVVVAYFSTFAGVQLFARPYDYAPPRTTPVSENVRGCGGDVVRCLPRESEISCGIKGDEAVRRMGASNGSCPSRLSGVWWLKDNPFPERIFSPDGFAWKGDRAYFWNLRHTARSATWLGMWMHLVSIFFVTHVECFDDGWIRTTHSFLPALHLFPLTLWIYEKNDNCFWRLSFDSHGRVTMRYEMFRILDARGRRSRHFSEFLASGIQRFVLHA